MNDYPTSRQTEMLRDVAANPKSTQRERAKRFGCSAPAVLALLRQLERRTLVWCEGGKYSVTKLGKAWLRPTMPTRRKDEAR